MATKITAAMVKELREATDAGMMECKKALVEADGDFDKAVDVLRTRGLAKAASKADRATNEGYVQALINEDNPKLGAVCRVNCETDFVALTDKFQGVCATFTNAVAANDPKDIDELLESEFEGQKIQDLLTESIHTIGENIKITKFQRFEVEGTGRLVNYIHMNGKIGVLVAFKFENEATGEDERFLAMGKDVAMQIAATNPVAIDETSVPEEVREHEMGIYKAQAAESGKPENIQVKIAEGRMKKFYKENCLLDQEFVKDSDKTVKQYIDGVAKELGDKITVTEFARIALGE